MYGFVTCVMHTLSFHCHTQVIDLMQKVLGETSSQIKETVKRDRCDWLAAIYNLLMDQPEGRNVLQRLVRTKKKLD